MDVRANHGTVEQLGTDGQQPGKVPKGQVEAWGTVPPVDHSTASLPNHNDAVHGGSGKVMGAALPDELVESILYLSDPNTFASLILLNRKWRRVSQSAQLYAHQLSRCPSYARDHHALSSNVTDADLPRLRRIFYAEAQRNLFEVFFRPRQCSVKFVSSCPGSYSSFPGGEAFNFVFSPQGRLLLALSSSRIYLVDLCTHTITVRREFKVRRRPASATVLDDGSRMAVLSTNDEVNVYDLTSAEAKRVQSFSFDSPVKAIALSPVGSVLAAAYDGHIGLCSPADVRTSTIKRAIKCCSVDSLYFSSDGLMLLGTTSAALEPSTVVIFCSAYQGVPLDPLTEDSVSQIWTSQIIFPHINSQISHATILPHGPDGETGWIFGWDHVLEVFRASPTGDDLNGGSNGFSSPPVGGTQRPSTLPAVDQVGILVAVGFSGRDIHVYGIPEDLSSMHAEIIPDQYAHGGSSRARSRAGLDGRQLCSVEGVSALRWVTRATSRNGNWEEVKRLVATAPGGVNEELAHEDGEAVAVDGGRIHIFDFQHAIQDGPVESIVIEVGEQEAEALEEEERELETEVALARRRTVAQRRTIGSQLRERGPRSGNYNTSETSTDLSRDPVQHPHSRLSSSPAPGARRGTEGFLSLPVEDGEEVEEALDAPYDHSQPRSRTALTRAATVAAASRRHIPTRVTTGADVQPMRANGRIDPPHESDADNWVPPPPPYTPNPERPLPEELLLTLLPSRTLPVQPTTMAPSVPARAATMDTIPRGALSRTLSTLGRISTSFRMTQASSTDPVNSASGNTHNGHAVVLRRQTPEELPITERDLPPLPVSATSTSPEVAVVDDSDAHQDDDASRLSSHDDAERRGSGAINRDTLPTRASSLSADAFSTVPAAAGFPDLSGGIPLLNLPLPESDIAAFPGTSSGTRVPLETAVAQTGRQTSIDIQRDTSSPFPFSLSPMDEPIFPTLPTAEQLATLQGRYSDTNRRLSRSPSLLSYGHQGYPVPRPVSFAPRGGNMHRSGSFDRRTHISRSSSRGSISARPQASTIRSGQRPQMQRMDTIRSVASAGESHPPTSSEQALPNRNEGDTVGRSRSGSGPRRMPRRAERSARVNLKQAKIKGWGTTKKKKEKGKERQDGGAGDWGEWTDLDNETVAGAKREKGQKCTVM